MMLSRLNFRLAVPVALVVVAALGIAKEIFHVPGPLLLFIGAAFAVYSIIFWSLQREHKKSAAGQLVTWLSSWSCITAAILGGAYHFDKAGWMWFKLTGYNVTLPQNLTDRVNVTPAAFVARYPFITIDPQDSSRLLIRRGDYEIDETIVVPPGLSLTIAPGTILQFGANCSLISYSPIIARGAENAPILFTAQNSWRKWGVVGVVHAGQSVFKYVRFQHGRQAVINNIDFPGTLSLVETDAEITHSHFAHLFGKDGAQVHGGQVFFRNNIFRHCFKDGVDFDGGAGEISHNRFEDCGDEAIDLGEDSRVQVLDNLIIGSKNATGGREHKLTQKPSE
jgi:hypothetical protein